MASPGVCAAATESEATTTATTLPETTMESMSTSAGIELVEKLVGLERRDLSHKKTPAIAGLRGSPLGRNLR